MNPHRLVLVCIAAAAIGRGAWATVEVPGPPARPSLTRAQALYDHACQQCHGEHGVPPPTGAPTGARLPSFSDPDWLDDQTPAEVFETMRTGHGDQKLGLQESWDAATFVWSFGRTPAQVDDGRRLFAAHCADCHGPAGDGIGAVIEERPATSSDFSLVGTLATDSDADLTAAVADGLPEFGMPPFADVLTVADRRSLIAYLRALPFSEVYFTSAAGRRASWRSPHLTQLTEATPEAMRAEADERRVLLRRLGALGLGATGVAVWWWRRRVHPTRG